MCIRDSYYDYHIQGTYNDKATPQTGYNYNNDTDYAATYIVKDKTGATNGESSWGRTTFVGGFMGTVVEKVIGSKAIWRGAGLVYAVEPESYVATAFSIAPDLSITDAINGTSTFKGLQLEVSADKSTWTPVTPEYSAEEDINGEDPYEWNCYKLVVKIPAGMNWYRLTLPGIKADASTTDEMTWVACPFENSCGFGPSIASKMCIRDRPSCPPKQRRSC